MTAATNNGPLAAALRIDPNRLEDECGRYPEQVYNAGMSLAHAIDDHDRARRNLDRIKAVAELEARAAPASDSRYRVTDSEIAAKAAVDPVVLRAYDTLAGCERKVGELQAFKDAVRAREGMIEHLVRLWLSRHHGANIEGRVGRSLGPQPGQIPPRHPAPPPRRG